MPFSRRSRAGSRAFTLLELIVVIVILGVLAAIAIPTFLAAQEKSRAAVAAETLSAEDRDARALMTLRNDGSTVPSADDYATAASELQASGLGLLAAQGRRLYIPASTASSVTNSLSNVSTYAVAPQLNVGEMTLSFSGGAAGLATLTSGDTCVLLADSGGVPVIQTKTHLGANCNGATALLSPSSLASVSYLAAASSPTAPTLAGVWGNQSVALSWTAPASNGANITGYNLYQNGVKVSTLAGTALSASVTGLTNGTQYSFTLSAVNAVGEGSQSTALSLTPATLPSAPAAPSVSASGTTLSVSWTAPANNGAAITGYNVYVNGTKTASSPVSGTSTSLTGLPNGTTYSVAVTAVNAAGEGPLSGTSSATTAPVAPVVTATPSSTSATSVLSWTAVPGAASYSISQASPSLVWNNVTATSFTTPALTPGTTYSYTVTAVNPAGGATSTSVTTQASFAGVAMSMGPANYWRLNETSGTTAANTAGGGAGTYSGGYTLGQVSNLTDPTSKAVGLDGSTGRVNVGGTTATQFANGLSISAWVYPTASSNWSRILEWANGGSNYNIMFSRNAGTNGLYYGVVDSAQVYHYMTTTNNSVIPLNTWTFVTLTVAADGTPTIYTNGVAQPLTINVYGGNGTTMIPIPQVARTGGYIGHSINSTNDIDWPGKMDDVTTWNTTLTASQVQSLYNAR